MAWIRGTKPPPYVYPLQRPTEQATDRQGHVLWWRAELSDWYYKDPSNLEPGTIWRPSRYDEGSTAAADDESWMSSHQPKPHAGVLKKSREVREAHAREA